MPARARPRSSADRSVSTASSPATIGLVSDRLKARSPCRIEIWLAGMLTENAGASAGLMPAAVSAATTSSKRRATGAAAKLVPIATPTSSSASTVGSKRAAAIARSAAASTKRVAGVR
jgi:hypothetical protein